MESRFSFFISSIKGKSRKAIVIKKYFLNIIILISIFNFGCFFKPSAQKAIIKIKGSDTMLKLTKALAEGFMKLHPEFSIYVEGGGSATGVDALLNGDVDICTASRTLTPEEVKLLAEKYNLIGISYIIAKDALSVYLNKQNPVKNISMDNLKNIFTCNITNWKDIGGENFPIKVIIRSPNSGTHLYFKEHVLGDEEYCSSAKTEATTNQVIEQVKENKFAIGYGGIGFKNGIYHSKINGIEPTEENVLNDKYPISRYLHFYVLNTPGKEIKEFIEWVISPAGQKIVREEGYIPLWEEK